MILRCRLSFNRESLILWYIADFINYVPQICSLTHINRFCLSNFENSIRHKRLRGVIHGDIFFNGRDKLFIYKFFQKKIFFLNCFSFLIIILILRLKSLKPFVLVFLLFIKSLLIWKKIHKLRKLEFKRKKIQTKKEQFSLFLKQEKFKYFTVSIHFLDK